MKHNPENERMKHSYLTYLKESESFSESTIDTVAMALDRFEKNTKHRDFKKFHVEQAIAFKQHLAEQPSQRTGAKLSKSTMCSTLNDLKRFFVWLAREPGYRSKLRVSDANYFNPSKSDTSVATARREKPVPTIEQIKHVLDKMPAETEIQRRDRALVAFTIATGARDSAIASIKLAHIDLIAGSVYQDARQVKTKFRKSFTTFFFPVGDQILQIVAEWVTYLREEKHWGNDDPVFPATRMVQGASWRLEPRGLERKHWSGGARIRAIFHQAFIGAGMPYFHPHSFRHTLARLGEKVTRSQEEFKAWSENLGHDSVATTFGSYGTVGTERRREIIRGSMQTPSVTPSNVKELAKALALELRDLR